MRVNHGGGYIAVAQQLLNCANVGARLQQVRGKAAAQGVYRNGMRRFCAGRLTPSSQGRSMPNTSRYRNRMALSAWLWVDADTFRSLASMLRNASTSAAPMSRGCRISPLRPCHRMKKPHPMQVGLLRVEAIVKVSNPLAQLVQKPCGVQNRRAGFHGLFIPVFLNSVSTPNPGCKPLSGGNRD